MYIYYPSCNFTATSPNTACNIQTYLKKVHDIPHAGCCRIDKRQLNRDETAITLCQACNEILDLKLSNPNRISLWEFLDNDKNFIYPDYQGKQMVLQDCYRDRHAKKTYEAVRSIMRKMNITIIEIDNHKSQADFCGLLHFTPNKAENIQMLKENKDIKLSRLPKDIQEVLMQEQVEKYQGYQVICYCNSCLRGIKLGGGNGIHLLDLVMKNYIEI